MKPKSEIKREKTCRICLCYAKVLKSLHDKFRDQENSILETINFVVNIDMQLKTDLPNKICDDCMTKLTMADIFKRRCLDSEEILGQYHPAYENEELIEESFENEELIEESLEKGESIEKSFENEELIKESFEEGPVTYYNEKETQYPLQNLIDDFIKKEDNLAVYANVTLTKNNKSGTDLHTIEPDNIECEDDVTSSILVETEPLDDTEYIDSNDAVIADEPLIKPAKSSNETAVKGRKRKEKGPFVCNVCGLEYRSEISLKAHRSRKHTLKTIEEFECPICFKKFGSSQKRSEHKYSVHRDTKVSCKKCHREFKCNKALRWHTKVEHGPKYTCKTCGHICATSDTFEEHRKNHHRHLCTICGKWIKKRFALQEHILRHKNVRPFQCDYCGQSFVTKSELRTHIRSHMGDLPYSCDVCGRGFIAPSSMVTHRRKHSDDRPYVCEYCPKSFKGLNNLNRHTRTHTGEKPYKCTVCDAAFTRSQYLTVHMKKHAKDTPRIDAVMAAAMRKRDRQSVLSKDKSGNSDT